MSSPLTWNVFYKNIAGGMDGGYYVRAEDAAGAVTAGIELAEKFPSPHTVVCVVRSDVEEEVGMELRG